MDALVKLTGGTTELTEAEELILAEMGEDANSYQLQPARVKIAPGGIGQFMLGDEAVKSFTAIVALSQIVRGYWPASGVSDSPPLCSSPDGVSGHFNVDHSPDDFKDATGAKIPHPGIIALTENKPLPDVHQCASCPMNQWGSEHQRRGGKGKGRACKEMRRLLLLIEGWGLPATMSLPPTSIKAWDAYCSALRSKKSGYFALWTRFELDSAKAAGGETYNIAKVSAAGHIADTDQLRAVAQIRSEYREFISGAPVEAAEYETAPIDGADTQPVEDDTPF